jgi:hypothetical protein
MILREAGDLAFRGGANQTSRSTWSLMMAARQSR